MNWILASGSPRRRELLEMLGVPNLTIRPAKGPERATPPGLTLPTSESTASTVEVLKICRSGS